MSNLFNICACRIFNTLIIWWQKIISWSPYALNSKSTFDSSEAADLWSLSATGNGNTIDSISGALSLNCIALSVSRKCEISTFSVSIAFSIGPETRTVGSCNTGTLNSSIGTGLHCCTNIAISGARGFLWIAGFVIIAFEIGAGFQLAGATLPGAGLRIELSCTSSFDLGIFAFRFDSASSYLNSCAISTWKVGFTIFFWLNSGWGSITGFVDTLWIVPSTLGSTAIEFTSFFNVGILTSFSFYTSISISGASFKECSTISISFVGSGCYIAW